MSHDENEAYCLERLGISNARGRVAEKLRSLSPAMTLEEHLDQPLSRGRFLVVDLETTGMKSDRSRIIEIGAVEVDGLTLGRELGSLVYPGVQVPGFITRLTGIDTQMVNTAPKINEILPVLERMLTGRILVAHNLSFDLSFLNAAWRQVFGRQVSAPTLCTVKLSRRTFPDLDSHNLDSLTSHLCIRPGKTDAHGRHRALGDAKMTAVALAEMLRKLELEGMENVGQLLKFQNRKRKSILKSKKF